VYRLESLSRVAQKLGYGTEFCATLAEAAAALTRLSGIVAKGDARSEKGN
jgi:hypothetical protein